MSPESIIILLAYFYLYSFVGWVCEDIYVGIGQRKLVNRGFLYGPYCPIYGFGALLVIYPLESFYNQPVLVFVLGILITVVLEYITSYVMEKLFHARWWDYSQKKFNIHGRVCALNAFLFGIMTLVAVYVVHPFMTQFLNRFTMLYLAMIVSFVTGGFLTDLGITVGQLFKQKNIAEKAYSEISTMRKRFETEYKESLSEFNERFHEWSKAQPEYPRMQELARRIEDIRHNHLSKAFPERVPDKMLETVRKFTQKLR